MFSVVKALLIVLGVLEGLLACTIAGCGIYCIVSKSRLYAIGHSIWTGVFFLMTAALAILAGVSERRGFHSSHTLAAILSCVFIIPCLVGLLVLELISDQWFSFWTDSPRCQAGCYTDEGSHIRVNYASLWTTVSNADENVQCSSPTWRTRCHPNADAALCEIVAIAAAAVLALMYVATALSYAIETHVYKKSTRKSDGTTLTRQSATGTATDGHAQTSDQGRHTWYNSWNIPQYNIFKNSAESLAA